MVSALFVWGITALVYLCTSVFLKCAKVFSVRLSYMGALLLVLLMTMIYQPVSLTFWLDINQWMQQLFTSNPKSQILQEVWHMLVYFRGFLPAFVMILLSYSISLATYPQSASYRMVRTFPHNRLWLLLFFLVSFYLLKHFKGSELYQTLCLNGAFFVAAYYWKFGFSLLIYHLKKLSIPYEISTLILIFLPIGVGEYFLIPLFLLVGLGISDIWMDYYQRDAATLLFNLNFN